MTMTAARVAGLLAPARDADSTDAELLGRFVAHRDGPTFAALVARHGPMVFGVCRRVLGDWHSAEDAFQAAFLVLARRAADVSPPGAVAGWLHGVACRVAKGARRADSRRLQRERPVAEFPETPAPDVGDDADLRALLDDELRKLPGKYRDLLVACDLEGRPRAPVAEALGIPEGTLSSRLTAARKMLAGRLARRGVAPAVIAAVAAGNAPLSACEVPRLVLASAARIGCDSPGTVPAAVASLASGAVRAMTVRKLLPYSLALVAASAAIGLATALPDTQAASPPAKPPVVAVLLPPRPGQKAEPKPAAPRASKMLVMRHGKLELMDPDGKNATTLAEHPKRLEQDGVFFPHRGLISPDGKRVAILFAKAVPPPPVGQEPPEAEFRLVVKEVGDDGPGTDLELTCQTFAWSPDGTQIACSEFTDGPGQESPRAKHFVVDVKTKKKTPLSLPESHVITDWSRDGKYFLTTSVGGEGTPSPRLNLMNRDGTLHKALTGEKDFAALGRIAPDGKRVLCLQTKPKEETPAEKKARQDLGGQPPRPTHELKLIDVATGKVTPVADVPLNADLQGFCWSPDGKRIAYVWREVHEGDPKELLTKETNSSLVTCDPDGQNQKTVLTATGKTAFELILGGVDWR